MKQQVKGLRPRPRAAFLGCFADEDRAELEALFPTIYRANTYNELSAMVDSRDIDVLLIGTGLVVKSDWLHVINCHVICFSRNSCSFPGPCAGTLVSSNGQATTIEYTIPDLPLGIRRLLTRDLQLDSIKGWPRAVVNRSGIYMGSVTNDPLPKSKALLQEGALVLERATGVPVCFRYMRDGANQRSRGVAWLPRSVFSQHKWVRAILAEWAALGCEELSALDDWRDKLLWQTNEEAKLDEEISELERELLKFQSNIESKIAAALVARKEARQSADRGIRQLLTGQGEELVAAVAAVLRDVGFTVLDVDRAVADNGMRLEDLRLTLEGNQNWTSIVEVRGYAKSTHKSVDLQRIDRFARLFHQREGCFPDKRLYVINGQIDLPPDDRQPPFSSSKEDISEFSRSDGLVIWSVDLFHAIVANRLTDIRQAILKETGQFHVSL